MCDIIKETDTSHLLPGDLTFVEPTRTSEKAVDPNYGTKGHQSSWLTFLSTLCNSLLREWRQLQTFKIQAFGLHLLSEGSLNSEGTLVLLRSLVLLGLLV